MVGINTRPDCKKKDVADTPVLKAMSVFDAAFEARAVARDQSLFARIGHQHNFALEYVNKLVFERVPMALARPGLRWKANEIYAELSEICGIAEPLPASRLARGVERRGIASTLCFGCLRNIDLAHTPKLPEVSKARNVHVLCRRKATSGLAAGATQM
jgi:hypothetical protein